MRGRYTGYRGKTSAQDAIRRVLVVVVVLLLLAAAGLMAVQRYIIYTDSGVRLELPFFRREEPPAPDGAMSLEVERREEPSENSRPGAQEDYFSVEW